MRTARPVGLTEDGQSLIVETADGESISVPADPLRTALRHRPRRHLETEMEQSMTPREIQMKIRAGASVEEIAEASGMPIARVEAFAAPVIAERNHIAGMAQLGSVRRAGEPAGHRTLRAALGERLKERGVDQESVEWDSFKMDDGRWSISAGYRVEQADRVAIFYFDQRGRFSVAGNDEARWAIGEQTAAEAAAEASVAAEDVDDVDTEPTLKLASPADELALLRAVETDAAGPAAAESGPSAAAEPRAAEPESAADPEPEPEGDAEPGPEAVDGEAGAPAESASGWAVVEETQTESNGAEVPEEPSQLDLLYDLLGSDGYAEDSIRVFEGLSDATAVPEVGDGGWQQSESDDDFPAEAEQTRAHADVQPHSDADADSEADSRADPLAAPDTALETELQPQPEPEPEPQPDPEPEPQPDPEPEPPLAPEPEAEAGRVPVPESASASEPSSPQREVQPEIFADGATQETLPEADHEAETERPSEPAQEPAADPAPKPKAKKRKRASVPSWDEIMFGSPKGKA